MPSIKMATWIHGNAARAEMPTVAEAHDGAGSHFLLNHQIIIPAVGNIPAQAIFQGPRQGTNWFHFALTTPVIIDDVRPTLLRCFVLFNAVSAKVMQMDLFDGSFRFAQLPNMGQVGGNALDIANAFAFTPSAPTTVNFGLGISVKVDFFFDTSTQRDCSIWFGAVGADFA
jgi:hypothetical protein